MTKQNFDNWIWDRTKVEVAMNTENIIILYFYGYVWIKKNNKNFFRWRLMSSPNYQHWHSIITKQLKWVEWFYNKFPCTMEITSLAWNKRKADCDNLSQWIMDTLVELWVLPDDNKFIIQELHIVNKGYAKNLALTKVVIKPYKEKGINDDTDYKEKDWWNYKVLLSN